MKFFTADTHFFHKKIIEYSNRPFSNIDDMNHTILTNWNSVVSTDDETYHLGDLSFGLPGPTLELLKQLNGRIYLIQGNHDKSNILTHEIKQRFEFTTKYCEIHVQDSDAPRNVQSITLCHYAALVWNKSHHGAWHLYGHSHGSLPEDIHRLSFDVGVDTHNFTPWSYIEVKEKMKTKNFKPIDHHGE